MTAAPRSLIVVRAGDASLHEGWMIPAAHKSFDVAVSYYGDRPGQWVRSVDHHEVRKGPKWPCIADWLDENWAWVADYDYVAMPDDDMDASATTWVTVFATMQRLGLDLAQPAFARDSHWCHPITVQVPDSVCRMTNFIENNLAVFSARGLRWCAPVLRLGASGVATDYAWPTIIRRSGGRVGIIDAAAVRHTRPYHGAGGSVYHSAESLASVLPHPELMDELLLMATFGIGNPYDPFVESTVGDSAMASPMPPPPAIPEPCPPDAPVTFVLVGANSIEELTASVDAMLCVAESSDEVLLVDATFDSHLRASLEARITGMTVVDAPDFGLAQCYDLAFRQARHDRVCVVGSGWLAGPQFRQQLSARGTAVHAIGAPAAPAGAFDRHAIAGIGGMSACAASITTGWGRIGTSELIRSACTLLAAAGCSTETVALDVAPLRQHLVGQAPAPLAPDASPTRSLDPALVDAVQPTAVAAALALADLVDAAQSKQYAAVLATRWPEKVGISGGTPDRWDRGLVEAALAGPYRTARLVTALLRRGNASQAAAVLQERGLASPSTASEVQQAVSLAADSGLSPGTIAARSAPELGVAFATALAALPVQRAIVEFATWWEAQPGSRPAAAGIMSMAPLLTVDAAEYWARQFAMSGLHCNPLLVISELAERSPEDRAGAVARCAALTGASLVRHATAAGPD